jgi:4-amino-4-deoxy-L-arabinose transferase-like glycosyltransferase
MQMGNTLLNRRNNANYQVNYQADYWANYQYVVLAILTVIAAALRFYKLGEWNFWIEEYHTLHHTAATNSVESVLLAHRPVFYLLSKPILLFLGVNEWSTRLLPALFGIVAMPIFFGITRKPFGGVVALLAILFLVISPWHIYWSQNARFYTLLLLLYSVSAFAFYWGVENDNFHAILIALVLLALAGGTHGLAILLLPIFVLYFLLLKILPFEKPTGLRWKNLLPFLLLPLIGYLILDSYRFLQGSLPLLVEVYLQFFNESTATFVGLGNPYILLTAVVSHTGTPIALLAVLGSLLLLRKQSRTGLFLTLVAFTPLVVIMALTPIASTSDRYVFMTLFFWMLLAAIAIEEMYKLAQHNRAILFIPLVGFSLLFLRDPIVEDLHYYLSQQRGFLLLFTLFTAILLIGAILVWRLPAMLPRQNVSASVSALAFVIIGATTLHAVATDSIYYLYQDGRRDNWSAATATIRAGKAEGDLVFAAMYTMGSYYLHEPVTDIQTIDLNTVLQQGNQVWFIEDEYMNIVMGHTFAIWAANHCQVVGNWDRFDTGRFWKMRVHLCVPTQ